MQTEDVYKLGRLMKEQVKYVLMQLIVMKNAQDSCSVITMMAQSDSMTVNTSSVLQEVMNREMPEWAIRREVSPWNYVRI